MTRVQQESSVGYKYGRVNSLGSSGSVRVFGLSDGPSEAVVIEENGDLVGFGESAAGSLKFRSTGVSFSKYFRPQTATQVPDKIGAALRACGMAENMTSGTYKAATYTLDNSFAPYTGSSADSSGNPVQAIDITVNRGKDQVNNTGIQEILKDCVGNAVIHFRAGQRAWADFTFIGRINSSLATAQTTSMTSDTAPTAFVAEAKPLTTSNASVSFAGVAAPGLRVLEANYDLGNQIEMREDFNGDIGGFSVPQIVGRQTSCDVLIESPLISTLDMFTKLLDNQTALTVVGTHAAGTSYGSEMAWTWAMVPKALRMETVKGIQCIRVIGQQYVTNTTTIAYGTPLALTYLPQA